MVNIDKQFNAKGLIQTAIQNDPVTCHMFEYTAQTCIDTDGRILTAGNNFVVLITNQRTAEDVPSANYFLVKRTKRKEN